MPRGIYKRKGRKASKSRVRGAEASVPADSTSLFVVDVEQKRRIAVYVKAHEVGDANMMAREYLNRQKKVTSPVLLPGVVIEASGMESRGVSSVDAVYYSPDQTYSKAAETPIQKVWAKDRSRTKSSGMVESASQRPSYKILPVRAK